MLRRTSLAILALLVASATSGACGGEPAQRPPAAPATPPGPAASPAGAAPQPSPPKADPWALPARAARPPAGAEPGEATLVAWKEASKTKFAPAPASCAAWSKRAPAKPAPESVVAAMAESDPGKRDAMLAALEGKSEATPGTIRALRADIAPVECADVLVDPLLAGKTSVSGTVGHALLGLSIAGKLARTGLAPPKMPAAKDKAKVKEFIGGPLKTWMADQAAAVQALSAAAQGLGGFGRAVAAVEAGTAELRLVDAIRSAPVPKEWDPELRQVYEVALDEALEPRKARGRDAALVGLGHLALLGIVHDARVDRTRALLSKLYGGRRIDALDDLLLPAAPQAGGFQSPFWLPLLGVAVATKDEPAAVARRKLDLGRKYWWRVDFVDAAYAAKDANDRLVLALALALAEGPANAAEMMHAAAPSALNLSHTDALDALAAEGGATAGMAAYDAAYLRSLSPPDGAAAGPYLRDVAVRFRKAESLLADAGDEKKAADRAADADAAASAAESTK